MKKIVWIWLAALMLAVTSCKDDNYLHAIPENVVALMAVDVPQAGVNVTSEFIDKQERLYLFETADGMFGLAARCTNNAEGFTIVDGKWACGYNGGRLLMLGPVLPAQQEEVKQRITKLLEQDEGQSIVGKPMLQQLDSIHSPIALVAQSTAVPEQFAALFTIGAPQNADPSMVFLSAAVTLRDGVLQVMGRTTSPNKSLNEYLKKSYGVFRPTNEPRPEEAAKHLFTLAMNVEGTKLLPLLQQNSGLQAFLAGLNTAIDMNKILKSVDGDFLLMVENDRLDMTMKAQLKDDSFVNDIGYWKSSCPAGMRIVDKGPRQWLLQGDEADFLFGVSDKREFVGELRHRKSSFDSDFIRSSLSLLRPYCGEVKSVVYVLQY